MMSGKTTNSEKLGFTLLELAIVLVIIGVVAGGLLVGKSLIHSAELRAIITDQNNFKTSINTFRLKYDGIPGDIANATALLGATLPNGNNNGVIDYNGGALGEEYNAWQHLSAAKLIAGDHDGTKLSLPKSKLQGGLYRISYQTAVYGKSANMISLNALNSLFGLAHNAILKPVDAFSIDSKLDDGLADSGLVLGFNPEGVPGCVTNYYSSATASYILTNNDVLCKLFFNAGF